VVLDGRLRLHMGGEATIWLGRYDGIICPKMEIGHLQLFRAS
jgi:hypothetical protein